MLLCSRVKCGLSLTEIDDSLRLILLLTSQQVYLQHRLLKIWKFISRYYFFYVHVILQYCFRHYINKVLFIIFFHFAKSKS